MGEWECIAFHAIGRSLWNPYTPMVFFGGYAAAAKAAYHKKRGPGARDPVLSDSRTCTVMLSTGAAHGGFHGARAR